MAIRDMDYGIDFDKKQNLAERLKFIRLYSPWIKSVPNEIWSKQQAEFIDSLFENAKNFRWTRKNI